MQTVNGIVGEYRLPFGVLVDEQTNRARAVIEGTINQHTRKTQELDRLKEQAPDVFADAQIVFAIPIPPNQEFANALDQLPGVQVLQLPYDKALEQTFVRGIVNQLFP